MFYSDRMQKATLMQLATFCLICSILTIEAPALQKIKKKKASIEININRKVTDDKKRNCLKKCDKFSSYEEIGKCKRKCSSEEYYKGQG